MQDLERSLEEQFLRTALKRSEFLEVNDATAANREFDKLHELKSELRRLPDRGKAVLERILRFDDVYVQISAAAALLAIDERGALQALRRIEGRNLGLASSTAALTIQEWMNGNIRKYWE